MKYTRFPLGVMMAALLAQGHAVQAQVNGSWLPSSGGGNWADATKWSSNPSIPGGAESTVTIGSNTVAAQTINLQTIARTVGILNLGNPAQTGSIAISNGSLTFDNGANPAQLNSVGGGTANSFTNLLTVGLVSNLIVNATNDLTISGVVSGAGSITKTGAGHLALSSASGNTFSGGFTLEGGAVSGAHNTSFGTGVVTIKSGTLLTGGGSRFYANNLVLDGDFNVAFGASTGTLNFSELYTVQLNRNIAITNDQGFGLLGVVSDGASTFGITKSGTAIMEIRGNNAYKGGFTLNEGSVFISAADGVNTSFGSGTLTLNGGSISTNRLRVIANDVVIGGDVNLNATPAQQMRYVGTTTLTGNRELTNDGAVSFVNGVSSAGVIVESGGSFSLTKSGTGNMTLATGNTYTGGTIVKSGTLFLATNSLVDSGSVHVNGGALYLGNTISDTVGHVKLTQGLISGSNSTSILTASGYEAESGGLSVILAGASAAFVKNGSGLVEYGHSVSGATYSNTYGGGTTINSGTLRLNHNNRLPNTGVLSAAGGVLDLNGYQDTVASVTMGGGTVVGGTLITTSLTANAGSSRIAANTLVSVSGAASVESGASLNVSGTLAGAGTQLAVAGQLTGNGFVNKTVVVQDGGTLSPGNSPGLQTYAALTLNGGGNYNWQVHDATGSAGVGFDTISVSGVLNLNGLSLDNPYSINLWSLAGIGPDVNGNALNFDQLVDQDWVLISAASINFSSLTDPIGNYFSVFHAANNGTAGFSNTFYGSFSVDVVGNDLVLHYAVPEPSTYALGALGGLGFMWMMRRRRVA